jgi:RNA polymerase sigma-70 factor (ECF subfamily)
MKPVEVRRSTDEAMACYVLGDDRAFAEVYAVIEPCLRRFYVRRLRDRGSVPDLVQETLLRVHRARESFAPGSALLPWVLTIARHLLIDTIRAVPREELTGPERLDCFSASPTSPALPNGEELLVAKEVAGSMDRALAGVSEPQRAALRLVKGEGLSVAAAAAALRTTQTGVKLRTHRALRTLRAHLEVETRSKSSLTLSAS